MTTTELQTANDARRDRMIRELQSDLSDLVAAGDITDEQANQWLNDKADQWKGDHE